MTNKIEAASPYYDDFDASKNFHKILYHPAKPVQARELTQMQSILQNQIKIHGDHVFKNGTMVVPGHVFYDEKVKFLKIETVHNQVNIEPFLADLVGKEVKGSTNGITALVVHYDIRTATDTTTIYIKYTSAAGVLNEFYSAETLTCDALPGLTLKITPVTSYTGGASICTVNDGIFYVNGYFVNVPKQTITISKYTSDVSAVIGLDYVESVVTENEDESLFDNATGFTNLGAPGAHRLGIALTLTVKPYDYTTVDTGDINFVDLLKIKSGKIEYLKNDTQYAAIEGMLAQRTFDESGNYAVKPFTFTSKEYRNNDRGQWTINTPYMLGDVVVNNSKFYIALTQGVSGLTAPVQSYDIQSDGSIYWNAIPNKASFVNSGQNTITSTSLTDHIEAESKMCVNVSSGKAYVKGYQVSFDSQSVIDVPKARKIKQLTQSQIYAPAGQYVIINDLKGMIKSDTQLTKLNLLNVAGTTIGTAWARSIEYSTGLTSSAATVEYRLSMFGVTMNTGFNFTSNVHSVSSTEFTATIKATQTALSGSVSASASTTITGVGTYFDLELKVGDRVLIGTTWTGVASITSPTVFVATSAITAAAGTRYVKGTSAFVTLGDYVRNLPSSAINTLRNAAGAIDMTYVVQKKYSASTASNVTTIVLPALSNGETYLPSEHIVVKSTGSLATELTMDVTYSLNPDASILTINGLPTIAATTVYTIVALVRRSGAFAKEKSKTLAVKTLTLTSATSQLYSSNNISLGEADGVRLIKVTESGDPVSKTVYAESGETDITSFYTFDNGQRPEFYDMSRVKTSRLSSRPIRITFEYFKHSDGDYFSKDSYSSVPKSYISPVEINSTSYYLPDCLDFRSRISSVGDFVVASGASVSDPLWSEATISTSYSYFLPRQDTLSISNKQFEYSVGGKSNEAETDMRVCTIDVPANTLNPMLDVRFRDDQIRGYTMKDVKSMDARLSDVEYYVTLTELEKATVKLSIKDSYGLEVDKHGFLVDAFANHDTADVTNIDYKASVDFAENECRASCSVQQLELVEPAGTTDSSRLANGYQLTGSLLSLPYTEIPLISQTSASKTEVVQSYFVVDFEGALDIYPTSEKYVKDEYTSNITANVLKTVYETPKTTSITYGPGERYVAGSYTDCGCGWFPCCNTHLIWASRTPKSAFSTSVTTQNVNRNKQLSNYTELSIFSSPTLRARTIVVAAKNLKPFTKMYSYLSENSMDKHYLPCTKIEITGTGKFIGHTSSTMTDNITARTTNNYDSMRNGFVEPSTWFGYPGTVSTEYLNYYDTIERGEVVTCKVGVNTVGTGVVVSDETIYDKVTSTSKRILYVINYKGNFVGGTLTGFTSGVTATVVSVSSGTMETNSSGNLYGAIVIPHGVYEGGLNKVLLSDYGSSLISRASSYADASYTSDGIINAHEHNVTYESQPVVITTTNVHQDVTYI